MAFAETHFELDLPPRGGTGSLRGHLRKVHEQTGHLDPRLAEESRLPRSLAHLMEWYLDLRASHAPGPGGPSALTYTELDAWARLTRKEPTPLGNQDPPRHRRRVFQRGEETRVAVRRSRPSAEISPRGPVLGFGPGHGGLRLCRLFLLSRLP